MFCVFSVFFFFADCLPCNFAKEGTLQRGRVAGKGANSNCICLLRQRRRRRHSLPAAATAIFKGCPIWKLAVGRKKSCNTAKGGGHKLLAGGRGTWAFSRQVNKLENCFRYYFFLVLEAQAVVLKLRRSQGLRG